MAGVKVPLIAMHHAYVVTERIEGIQVGLSFLNCQYVFLAAHLLEFTDFLSLALLISLRVFSLSLKCVFLSNLNYNLRDLRITSICLCGSFFKISPLSMLIVLL